MPSFDVIVIGLGGAGSSALNHLARRGVRSLGLDQFPAAHDRGSSHGHTRMIRQAHYEEPAYVPLVLWSYPQWLALEQRTGRRLYHEVGVLQVGPSEGTVIPGVLASARAHGLEVEPLSAAEIELRFPGFRARGPVSGLFERRAGYLLVEDCITTQLHEAAGLGAELRTDEHVHSWRVNGRTAIVETEQGEYQAGRLIIAAGAWSAQLLAGLGINLTIRRKPQYWYAPRTSDYRNSPGFLFDAPAGLFYGFPDLPHVGLKVAQHSGGEPIAGPDQIDRNVDPRDQQRVEAFLGEYLPGVSQTCLKHSVCMYVTAADDHFIVDRHPHWDEVVFAAALSGHGFKFTPALGQALADLALEGSTKVPTGFLRFNRPALTMASRS